MSFLIKRLKRPICPHILVSGIGIVALAACSFGIPKPMDSSSGALGLQVERDCPASRTCPRPQAVYFVPMREGADLKSADTVFLSNYIKGNTAYLLNAQPGRYVAVAAIIEDATDLFAPRQPERISPGEHETRSVAYFQTSLVNQTTATVESGKIAFAGRVTLGAFGQDYDDLQRRWSELIQGSNNPEGEGKGLHNVVVSTLTGDETRAVHSWSAPPQSFSRDRSDESAFLLKAESDLKGSRWSAMAREEEKVLTP